METPELSNWLQELKRGYNKLLEISQRQLEIIKSSASSDELWPAIQHLTDEKTKIQSEIEILQHRIERAIGLEGLKAVFQQDIRKLAESARVLTFEGTRHIEMLMISNGKELNSTKTQRKVFHAYSGMYSEDQISYFFDEKK